MNEQPIEQVRTLCAWIELICKDIDKATAAEPGQDNPPGWWIAMRALQDEAYRCKCALPPAPAK